MKKLLKTGKKALSVIMAVMMVLTAWVWVAPTEASAATMGNYEVTIKFNLEDDDAVGGHVVIWYYPLKADNSGFDTTVTNKKYEVQSSLAKAAAKDHEYTKTIPGFPWRLELKIDDSDLFDETYLDLKYFKIGDEVIVSSSIGDFQNAICYFDYNGAFTPHDESGKSIDDEAGRVDSVTGEGFTWELPKPDSNSIIEYSDVKDMTCPETGSVTQTVKVKVNDQYGVPLYNPKWSVKGSVCGTTGISVTSTTVASDSTVITLTNAANVASNVDTQTGTITADWGTGTFSDTFTITDSYYTATFSYQTQNADNKTSSTKTEKREGYHGDSITAPTPPQYYDQDYLKTFSAWTPSFSSTITKDVTYTATYTSQFIKADYSAVDAAIVAVNAKKAEWGNAYESRFTYSSRKAIDDAVNAVVRDLGRTQQTIVDGYAAAINDALAALETNKYAVIFLDNNGSILLYEKNAEYESSITPPVFPEDQKKYFDSEKHYTYTGWDTDEYTSVVDDLVILPVYEAQAHNFTKTEIVTSTCTQKGATKHICECGYYYVDGETEYGSHVWSEEYKTDIHPTCTTAGQKSKYCTECGVQGEIVVIPASGHQWGTVSSLAPATCDRDGIDTRLCDACGVCEHTIVPATGHNYTITTVAPTCTAKGYDEYTCANCGHSYRDYNVDMLAHVYTEETLSAPACDIPGVKKLTCDCGHVITEYIDALSHDNIDDIEWDVIVPATCEYAGYQTKNCLKCGAVIASEVIPALTHDLETTTTPATCTTAGTTVVTCKRENCGYEKTTVTQPLTHNWNNGVEKKADCTHSAYTLYTCQRENCGETKIEVKDESAPALGHDFSGEGVTTPATCTSGAYITYTCQREGCKETKVVVPENSAALGHDFSGTESNVVDATCTKDGSKTVKCIRCDETTDVIIPHKGHTWGNWNITTPATNTTPGEMTRTCSNNKCTDTVVIPAGGHIWDNGTETLAPTCTKTGTIVYKCTAHANCGVKIEVTLPMLQHNYTTEYVDSTCDRAGYIRTSCTVCKKLIVDKSISPKAHTFDNGTKYPATCTDAAYHLYQCINTDAQGKDNCNYSYKAFAGGTDAALGHNLVAGETTATCEGTGSQIFYCDRENCGYSTSVEMPALGHNYEAQGDVVSATCTAPATQVYKCTACNAAYTKLVEAEKGHSFGNWTVTQDATTDKFGIQERSCSVCGYVEYDKIAPIGNHVFKEEILSSATCTTDGMISYTCTVATHGTCSANYTKTIPATGHTEAFAYEAATCSKGGFAKMYCSTCTTVLSEQKIDKLGCDWVQGEVTSSTCSTKGSIAYECSRCGSDKSVELSTNENAHQYETKVTNATCYKEGSVVTKCKLCQNKLSEETLIKTEHTWDDGTETTPATCTTKGEKTYKCTVEGCTATKTEPIDALGHDWGNWFVEKASTNTDKGEMKRTCNRQNCNAYETHEIPAGGHEWDEGEVTKEATCTSTGTKVYSCKNHTGDNACGITFTVTLDKLQHELTTSKTDATCTKNGEVVTKCKNCNTTTITTIIPATGHNYKPGEEVEATCDKSGYKTYKCDNCNETYNEINGNAKGHDLEEIVTSGSCTKAGEVVLSCKTKDCDYSVKVSVPALGHDYKKISSTDATCAAAATETYKCSRCEASYTVSVGDKLTDDSAHDWSTWTVVVEATEASIGYKTRECRICHKLKIDTIDATGEHKFEDGEAVEDSRVDPTCTDNGHETRKCSVHEDCGETAVVTIPATGHAEEKIVAVAATCTTDGSSEGSKCTKCGTVLVAPVTLPKLGHAWGNEKVTPATCKAEGKIEYICTRANCNEKNTVVIGIDNAAHNLETTVAAATCTENGSVTVSCKNEGCTYSEVVEIILAKGHSFTGKETLEKAASCTENGSKTVQCASCNVTDTIVLPKLGHNMVKGDKVDATCTTSGYTPYICDNKDCDHSYRVYDEAVVEHNYVQVEGSSTATCLAGGTVTMQCSVCKDEITAAVPALGHSYGDWSTINPTASTEGSKTRECSVCKTKETVILPALGHEMIKDEKASKPATCTEEGTDVYVCTTHTTEGNTCGYTYSVKVPVIAHNYDESIYTKVTTVAPTCTENGSKTIECKDCNATVTTVIPRTGHTMSTTVTEATCKAAGSVVTDCTVEGCDYEPQVVVLKMKPHTISVVYAYPSCTINGYVKEACDKCDYEKILSTTPALGHSYTEDVEVTKPAGCLEPGKKTVKCSRCTATTEVDIPATGHNYQPGEEVEATCTTSGYVPYSCQNEGCSSSYNNLTSNPNGHKWSTHPEDGEIKVTCEIDGKATYKCEKCEATNVVITPKFGHSWTPWTVSKAPTANSTGESTRTCLREGCSMVETLTIPALGESVSFTVSFVVEGKLISTQKVSYGSAATAPEVAVKAPDADYHYSFSWDTDFAEVTADLTVNGIYTATGHTYGEWITDIPAGCNNSGLRHRVCACGYIDEDVVAKLSHDFSEVIEEKPATCTENGYRVVVCKNCGAEETQTLKRLGHSMTYYSGYAATCDSEGIANHYNCSRCGKDFEDKNGIIEITSVILVKKYHTFVVVDGSTATCTSDGVTDYKFCTMCGYVQHSETIPAYGHTDADGNDRCDRCGILYENNGALVCSCNCHKKGTINELFYKILLFFWKLFGINKSCDCGTVHY